MIYLISNNPWYEEEVTQNFEAYELSSIDKFKDWIRYRKEVQIDSETEGFDPYQDNLLCIQIGDYENQWVIDCSTVDVNFLKPYFLDQDLIKVFQNAFFDLRFLLHQGIEVKNIYDTFLAERTLTLGKNLPKGYLGLQELAKRYLGIDLSKEVRGEINWRGLDSRVIQYAANDVKYLSKIKEEQLKNIIRDDLSNCLRLENRFISTLAKVAYKGFKINPEAWLKIYRDNQKLLQEYEKKLSTWIEENNYTKYLDNQLDMFSDERRCSINWNSSQQVIKLFKDIGINTMSRDGESVEIKHLIKQKSKFNLLPIYIKYKEIQKELSTYGEEFIKKHLNPVSGRVHSEFFPILDTGRISSSNPNLQNITATDDLGNPNPLRESFVAEKGNTLIIADYSQQEPRITAEYCQDPTLVDFILNGDGDSHSLTSTAISEYLLGEEVKVTKKNNPLVSRYNQKIRDIGKMINLGLDYGKTAYSVKDDLETTQEEAQKLIDILKAKFPKKEEYFKRCINFTNKHGYIILDKFTKRRTYFSDFDELKELEVIPYDQKTKEQVSKYYKTRGQLERFSKNYPIQGTGGSMTKLAAILFEEEVKDKAIIVNLIHDEIVAECKIEDAEEVSEILERTMIKAGEYFCKTIPMKVELFKNITWNKH